MRTQAHFDPSGPRARAHALQSPPGTSCFGKWKYLKGEKRSRLYDLEKDPAEQTIRRAPQQRALAKKHLADHQEQSERIRSDFAAVGNPGPSPAVQAEVEESLRVLGYIE